MQQAPSFSSRSRIFAYTIAAVAVAVLLYMASRSSFLLFHGIAEIFSVAVAFGVFIVAWHTRKIAANTFLLVLGIAYLQVGFFHLVHLFAYKGMGVFPEADSNLPTQLWIAARYIESLALLIAPALARRKIDSAKMLWIFSSVSFLIIASIFGGIFPDAFVEGQGLTPFKVISEYVVASIMAVALLLIFRDRDYFGSSLVKMVIWSIILSISAEMFFTLYVDVYGLTNLAGHYLKIISVFLLYQAIIVNGLEKPYDNLFIDLKRHEKERESFIARVQQLSAQAHERAAELKKAHDELEKRVEERTQQLGLSLQRIREEVREREKAESGLYKRQQALESVYAMATTFDSGMTTIIDQVAYSIAKAFEVSFVSVFGFENDRVCTISQIYDGEPVKKETLYRHNEACNKLHDYRQTVQFQGRLREKFPDIPCMANNEFRTYVGLPALSHTGEPIGFICIMDKKERTFSEFELHLLEIFVRYFSHELERNLMEKELRKGERMKMLGQLTSGVAHEVRNPLNAIQAITQALFEEFETTEDTLLYKNHIATQVERLTKLMQDLLDFGKPVDQQSMELVSITRLCEKTVSLWNHSHGMDGDRARFISGVDGTEIYVSADSTKLQQVLINLLDNAHQHSPQEQPITLELYRKKETDLRIRICDRGAGIKPEIMNRLFEPFFTTRKQGTGLGLGIVKHIVETHGGGIEVWNNTDGPGCTFEIRLPEHTPTSQDSREYVSG